MNLRAALIGSLVLHAGLAAAFGGGFLWGASKAPAPVVLTADFPVELPMDMDLPALEPDLPVVPAAEPGFPDPFDPPPEAVDARFLDPDGPPGPPAEVIGISSIDGRRRGLPGAGGGGRRGPAPAPVPPAVEPPPEPPPREPVFLPPSLREDRAPDYPPEMRRRGVEGTVRVRVEVEADGRVREAGVARSSGHAAFDAAAVEAAAAWVFLPATEDGKPVAAVVYRWVTFRLTDGR